MLGPMDEVGSSSKSKGCVSHDDERVQQPGYVWWGLKFVGTDMCRLMQRHLQNTHSSFDCHQVGHARVLHGSCLGLLQVRLHHTVAFSVASVSTDAGVGADECLALERSSTTSWLWSPRTD